MSDEKSLIKIDTANAAIQVSQVGGDADALAKVTTSGDYLPRLQLMTSNSDKCKQGDFPINHYAMIRDQTFTDLGTDVDVLVIAWRPKALEIGEELISSYDPDCETFKSIESRSAQQNSGCMFGPEFLVYIPEQRAFATFFMGSKSARKEAPNVHAKLQKSGTLSSKLIETTKFKWQAPLMKGCSTPIDLPDKVDIDEQVQKFLNPKESDLEIADDSGSKRAR